MMDQELNSLVLMGHEFAVLKKNVSTFAHVKKKMQVKEERKGAPLFLLALPSSL